MFAYVDQVRRQWWAGSGQLLRTEGDDQNSGLMFEVRELGERETFDLSLSAAKLEFSYREA